MVSCKNNSGVSLFSLQENTGIDFNNKVIGTEDFNVFIYRNFYNGAGVAIGDLTSDGLPEIFFTSNMGENKLYLNKGDLQFEDVTAGSKIINKGKWATGVVLADVNADGFLDIYVCFAGFQKGFDQKNELYINNHNLTFSEEAAKYGLDDNGYSTHAAFFDYDMDGDLDCFIINNSFIPVNTLNYANTRDLPPQNWPVADFLKGGGNKLLKNEDGQYRDVSIETGIHTSLISFGLGVNVGDVNGDAYPDVYVSNDFFERDYLYINQKNGTFKDELEDFVQHTSLASMGADMGDINNDGYPEIFTTDMLPDNDYRLKTTSLFDNFDVYALKERLGFYHQFMQNTLQLNNRNGRYVDIANYSGVQASDWSWGALMFDMNNDGLNDLYVCNGIYYDVTDQDFIDYFANDVIQKMALTGVKEQVDGIIQKMPSNPVLNKAYLNKGNLKFDDAGPALGFSQPSFSNGAAYGDLDNDGDLDLVINNVNAPAFVYKNNSSEQLHNNYLSVLLKGSGKNMFAVGARIMLYKNDTIFSRDIMPSRGFQSSVDYKQVIGIGKNNTIDSMIIIWPDRISVKIDSPEINTLLVIQKTQPIEGNNHFNTTDSNSLFRQLDLNFQTHTEDKYIDFYEQRNLPSMLSREGPKIAKADVNGDGLEDFYIGGAKGQPGQLFLQTKNGFINKAQTIFNEHAGFEDVAVVFFDADSDGDNDLYLGAGGNNLAPRSKELSHRLYLNDGKGSFSLLANAFPENNMNISVAVANDFDADGNIDLFVGSRSIPYSYGATPVSYLFHNDGTGHFTDVAEKMNPKISKAGLVTGAVWADVSGDSREELIIVGEWMPVKIFSFNGNTFSAINAGKLSSLDGWWQTIAAADMNDDGLQDLIIGNIGENFYLKPDSSHPVKIWLNDFDNNGTADQFITRTIEGRDVPVFLKKDVTMQFPALRKLNFNYTDYASKTIQQLFDSNLIRTSDVKEFDYCSSIIAYNKGNGQFEIQKLPIYVQFSSVNAVCVTDVNNDGKPDLVLGGNNYKFPPQFGRLDQSFGDVLINMGNKKFSIMDHATSGINLTGEVKDINALSGRNKHYILFARNNNYPVMYELKNGTDNL